MNNEIQSFLCYLKSEPHVIISVPQLPLSGPLRLLSVMYRRRLGSQARTALPGHTLCHMMFSPFAHMEYIFLKKENVEFKNKILTHLSNHCINIYEGTTFMISD